MNCDTLTYFILTVAVGTKHQFASLAKRRHQASQLHLNYEVLELFPKASLQSL